MSEHQSDQPLTDAFIEFEVARRMDGPLGDIDRELTSIAKWVRDRLARTSGLDRALSLEKYYPAPPDTECRCTTADCSHYDGANCAACGCTQPASHRARRRVVYGWRCLCGSGGNNIADAAHHVETCAIAGMNT